MILSDVSVARPVFASVLSLLLVAFGLVAFDRRQDAVGGLVGDDQIGLELQAALGGALECLQAVVVGAERSQGPAGQVPGHPLRLGENRLHSPGDPPLRNLQIPS